jgi:hypothetical protein
MSTRLSAGLEPRQDKIYVFTVKRGQRFRAGGEVTARDVAARVSARFG